MAIFPIESASQVSLIAVSVLGIILPVTAVLLRLMARKLANRRVDASDYCALAGCVSAYHGTVVSR